MEERRKLVRRKADRELLEWVRQHRAGVEAREQRHEKRRAIRHTCKVTIELIMAYSSGRSNDWSVDSVEVKGRLLDLSENGAALMTRERFETGQELRLGIHLPSGTTINTVATIRWTKAVPEKGACASGVQFKHVADRDRQLITEFLKELDTAPA